MDLEEGGRGVEWLLALSPGAGHNWVSLLCFSCWVPLPPDDSLEPDAVALEEEEVEEEVLAWVVTLEG